MVDDLNRVSCNYNRISFFTAGEMAPYPVVTLFPVDYVTPRPETWMLAI